jgi:tRNA(fMet)-specific endonuclease VapC
MSGYLLDTNIASHVIRGDRPEITRRLRLLPISEVAVSAVTEGELRYGLARRGYPPLLSERIRQFLMRVDVLPWDREVARTYGDLRASCDASGVALTALDMMIAAHAVAADAVLVTRDRAFAHVPAPFRTERWTA